jgi:thermostable 8-oxoguanine DNA glycosylase
MFNIKAEGIDNLHDLWRNRSELFDIDELSSRSEWRQHRNKLVNKLNKLGMAKTSFALEMLHPLTAKTICIDRHMFKAFGWENVDVSSTKKQYEYFEDYWLDLSEEYKISPAISRNLFWDIIQQEPSSMYWGEYLQDYAY